MTLTVAADGPAAVDASGRVRLSVTARRLLGVGSGSSVLLSASAASGALVVLPMAALDALVEVA